MSRPVAVIGAGTMGSGIAQLAALAGERVLLYDVEPNRSATALENIKGFLDKMIKKGQISVHAAKATGNRIQLISSMAALQEAGLVIEAIVENLEIKKELFQILDAQSSPETILATNTSSLSVTAIAAACKHPERVIGTHFFNPAPLMSLVEVIPGLRTRPATVGAVIHRLQQWKKSPVAVKDTPGFIVNRVARPYYSESIRLFEEGIATVETIDAAMQAAGFPLGPFLLMDYIGNDINYAVTENMFNAYYGEPRYRPSITQLRLVEAGRLGRKSGHGFYPYPQDDLPQPDPDPAIRKRIVDRITTMLVNEAADAWYFGIAGASGIDEAMQSGARYPIRLLYQCVKNGVDHFIRQLEEWQHFYGEDRYRVSPGLRMIGEKLENFYTEKPRL